MAPCVGNAIRVLHAGARARPRRRSCRHWRRRHGRGRRRHRRRHGAGRRPRRARAYNLNVCAVAELLRTAPLLARCVRRISLQEGARARAAHGAAPGVCIPAPLLNVPEVAAIAIRWDAAVGCPPPPLHRAVLALQVSRNPEVHFVLTDPWRKVPALRMVRIQRLARPTRIVRHAVTVHLLRRHAMQNPLVQAARRTLRVGGQGAQALIADAHLHVAPVVCADLHSKLYDLPCCVGAHGLAILRIDVVAGCRPLTPIAADTTAIAALRAVTVAR
mmetsp:Transcript_52641/g.135888  ORF Transcript_52641/g.135888 Transcript_52641/m.135888 type:complete len:274 (+) Transcript_52641:191-1012(+)